MNKQNQKNKRKRYTNFNKIAVLNYQNDNPCATQEFLASKFRMPKGTINELIKNKEKYLKIEEKYKNQCRAYFSVQSHGIYEPLYEWIVKKRKFNHLISNGLLMEMATKIAEKMKIKNFKASTTWITRFKKHFGIKHKIVSGEEVLVNPIVLKESYSDFQKIINKYDKKDIWNCDETGLFFRCPPKKTLMLSEEYKVGGRFSKERITILFCISLMGEKEKPLIIGKFKTPRGFKNLNFDDMNVKYDYNKKSWMTCIIFINWLDKLKCKFKKENRKILLLLDNAPVHIVDKEFSNIKLYYLPPNTTSRIQPLDQGIIKAFKDIYKKVFTRNISIENEELKPYEELINKTKLVDVMPIIINAWDKISKETIINCLNHSLKNWSDYKSDYKENKNYLKEDMENLQEENIPTYDQNDLKNDEFLNNIETNQDKNEEINITEENVYNEVRFFEALECLKKLERYFLKYDNNVLGKVDDLINELNETKKKQSLKITDFLVKKNK